MFNRLRDNIADNFSTSRAVDLRGAKVFLALALTCQFVIPTLFNPAMWGSPSFHLVQRFALWSELEYGHLIFASVLALCLLLTHRKSWVSLFAMLTTFLAYSIVVASLATSPTAISPISTGTGNYTLFAGVALLGFVWSCRVVGTNGRIT